MKLFEQQLLRHYRNGQAIPAHLLTDDAKRAIEWMQGFEMKHGQKPSEQMLADTFKLTLTDILDPPEELFHRINQERAESALSDVVNLIADGKDPIETFKLIQTRAEQLTQAVTVSQEIAKLSDYDERIKEYIKRQAAGIVPRIASFGFPLQDELLNGIERSDLIVIYGRFSDGKSTYARKIATNAAMAGSTVLLFALEESAEMTMQMLEASYTGMNAAPYTRGTIDPHTLQKHREQMASIKKNGGDVYSISLANGIHEIMGHLITHKPDFFILDQLTVYASSIKWDVITEAIKAIKLMIMNTEIPGIVLTQANRGGMVGFADGIGQYADKLGKVGPDPKDESEEKLITWEKNRRGRRMVSIPLNWDLENGIVEEKENGSVHTRTSPGGASPPRNVWSRPKKDPESGPAAPGWA